MDEKQQRLYEFQRLKANCKPDELQKLQIKCEILVRECIAGLLVNLTNDDFKSMEGKIHQKNEHKKSRENNVFVLVNLQMK